MTTAEVTENTIVGMALYIELVPTTGDTARVTQLLLTPEGYDHTGSYVRMAYHSRTISPSSPRKQWRINFSEVDNKDLIGSGMPVPQSTAQELAITMLIRFESSLMNQIKNKFVVRKRPIVVELSASDLHEISKYDTPQALMRRLQKARVACGLPEKLV
jgi:hypothetical protein